MNILGISGLNNAIPFKRAHWPGLSECEYRISQGHDASAALVSSGIICGAAAEERFNGLKHSSAFPIGAATYCLAERGIAIDQIDEIAHGFDYAPYQRVFSTDPISSELYRDVFSRDALLRQIQLHFPGFPAEKVFHVDHHLAHAASAVFTSGWDDCLAVVIDGMGEAAGATVYRYCSGKLHKLRQISANHSIGILYSLLTLHLGFDFNSDEYKIMGLAPYGNPARYRDAFIQLVELRDDGTIRIPILGLNQTRADRECYAATRRFLHERLIPERHPDSRLSDDHRDIAAALQECLERVVFHICGSFQQRTGCRRLALAGGVALNCTSNGKLIRSGMFDEVYVQPAAGDDGIALGAALYRASVANEIQNTRMPPPLLGPVYSRIRIEEDLAPFLDQVEVVRFKTVEQACSNAAALIAAGRVIGWCRGRMEFGPRALGNRSILADPGHPEMRDRINAMVKKREAFRPFAPAVSLEQVHRWFDVMPGSEMPYMISIVNVRRDFRSELPAITHVNGSARVQTVSASDNPDFHLLLKHVGKVTGREMVLNTSFNIKGQPIVNTPHEAIRTYLGTEIDYLFLDNFRLKSRKQSVHRFED